MSTLSRDTTYTLFLSFILLFSGCGGGGGGTTNEPPTTLPLADQLQSLEDSGTYPKLDRSTDLAGPDSNNNGVRDDVETYIDSLGLSQNEKMAALQIAETLQQTLSVDVTDSQALREASKSSADAIHCLSMQVSSSSEILGISGTIEAVTFNTKERALKYIEYNKAQSGSISRLPSTDTCN